MSTTAAAAATAFMRAILVIVGPMKAPVGEAEAVSSSLLVSVILSRVALMAVFDEVEDADEVLGGEGNEMDEDMAIGEEDGVDRTEMGERVVLVAAFMRLADDEGG